MLGFLKKFRRKKEEDLVDEEVDYFRKALGLALELLLSSYERPLLKWYELLIIVITGAFLGLGFGIMLYMVVRHMYPPPWSVVP